MLYTPLLFIHICAAVVGLLAGYLAMFVRKGSGWHQVAGTTFFVSMIAMSTTAGYIALFLSPVRINVVAASLMLYLVLTSWWAAKRRDGRTGPFDVAALLFISAVTMFALLSGVQAKSSASGTLDRMPAMIYFVFGSVALLLSAADVRHLIRGGVTGPRRIARHLIRMCLALLLATFSFYPGQGKLFSKALKDSNLMFIPHVLLIGTMLLWIVRMRSRRRAGEGKLVASAARA
jgi:hypothetical protein